jgi:CDP-glucose 4,6-dehydratase
MNLIQFGGVYSNCPVLVTGDSGFKGSWLTLWLQSLGAIVTGIALEPDTQPNHSQLLNLRIKTYRGDIANGPWLRACVAEAKPEIVFHLAAQSLVRRSYRDPLQTWQSNLMGTVNLLEACRHLDSVRAVVLITTDKVYKNEEWSWGYRESDRIGGYDAYSASKACCELAVDSYRSAFFNVKSPRTLLASVRAGNVIGGGDWAEDRLIPDIVRATAAGKTVEIRSPQATRPWQHVLDCLASYLMIGQRLLNGDTDCATAWNIGPDTSDNRRVIEVLQAMKTHWPEMAWNMKTAPQPHEANLLYLDSSRAKSVLGWQPVWNLATALEKTAVWYRTFTESQRALSLQQLEDYVSSAQSAGCMWTS